MKTVSSAYLNQEAKSDPLIRIAITLIRSSDGTEINITERVLDRGVGQIYQTVEETLGNFAAGDVSIICDNSDGYFLNDEKTGLLDAVTGDEDFKIRIQCGYEGAEILKVFEGILGSDTIKRLNKWQIQFTAYSYLRSLAFYWAPELHERKYVTWAVKTLFEYAGITNPDIQFGPLFTEDETYRFFTEHTLSSSGLIYWVEPDPYVSPPSYRWWFVTRDKLWQLEYDEEEWFLKLTQFTVSSFDNLSDAQECNFDRVFVIPVTAPMDDCVVMVVNKRGGKDQGYQVVRAIIRKYRSMLTPGSYPEEIIEFAPSEAVWAFTKSCAQDSWGSASNIYFFQTFLGEEPYMRFRKYDAIDVSITTIKGYGLEIFTPSGRAVIYGGFYFYNQHVYTVPTEDYPWATDEWMKVDITNGTHTLLTTPTGQDNTYEWVVFTNPAKLEIWMKRVHLSTYGTSPLSRLPDYKDQFGYGELWVYKIDMDRWFSTPDIYVHSLWPCNRGGFWSIYAWGKIGLSPTPEERGLLGVRLDVAEGNLDYTVYSNSGAEESKLWPSDPYRCAVCPIGFQYEPVDRARTFLTLIGQAEEPDQVKDSVSSPPTEDAWVRRYGNKYYPVLGRTLTPKNVLEGLRALANSYNALVIVDNNRQGYFYWRWQPEQTWNGQGQLEITSANTVKIIEHGLWKNFVDGVKVKIDDQIFTYGNVPSTGKVLAVSPSGMPPEFGRDFAKYLYDYFNRERELFEAVLLKPYFQFELFDYSLTLPDRTFTNRLMVIELRWDLNAKRVRLKLLTGGPQIYWTKEELT